MYKKYVKRIIDVIISMLFLFIFLPIYILIALIIKIEDKGKIIYKQKRTGLNGNEFNIYKFKTMKKGKITKLRSFLKEYFFR